MFLSMFLERFYCSTFVTFVSLTMDLSVDRHIIVTYQVRAEPPNGTRRLTYVTKKMFRKSIPLLPV